MASEMSPGATESANAAFFPAAGPSCRRARRPSCRRKRRPSCRRKRRPSFICSVMGWLLLLRRRLPRICLHLLDEVCHPHEFLLEGSDLDLLAIDDIAQLGERLFEEREFRFDELVHRLEAGGWRLEATMILTADSESTFARYSIRLLKKSIHGLLDAPAIHVARPCGQPSAAQVFSRQTCPTSLAQVL